jgi:hypothetical protein
MTTDELRAERRKTLADDLLRALGERDDRASDLAPRVGAYVADVEAALQELFEAGKAYRVGRGYWRAR